MTENMDCLTFLKNQPDKSVDLVFYDPPYNIKKKYDGYDDNKTVEYYRMWMENVYVESERVSKRGVAIYIGGKLLKMFGGFLPDNTHLIVVHKRAAGVFSGNFMLQYHGLYTTAKPAIKCKDLWDDVRLPGEGYYFREPRYEHPGLTGLALTRKVLNFFTLPGETVLDPFAGVGTTSVACKLDGRKYVGCEQSKKYIAIAEQRLREIA